MEDLTDLRTLLLIVVASISIGSAVYTWFTQRSKANSGDIAQLEERVRLNEMRLERIDERLRDVPEIRREIGDIHTRINEVNVTTHNVSGQIKIMTNLLDIIQKVLTRAPET